MRRDPRELVRPEIRDLKAYHLDQVPYRFKLDQNEVPWDLPRYLKEEVAARLLARNWAHYPDFHSDDLRQTLAEIHQHPFAGILVGNGSNELLGVSLEALTRPGGEVLGTLPSFGLYRMFVLRAAGRPRFLGPSSDLRLPFSELVAEIERDPRRPVILCSPNNPTGDAISVEAVESLLERLEAPLLLDNAYGEFCRYDYRPLLARHSHLLLFRTFSKAWSLGGMRLGYLLAHPDLVAELIKVKLPYNLSHAGAVIGQVVLEAAGASRRRVEALLALRERWRTMLESFALEVFPSEANYLLVRVDGGSRETVDRVRRGLGERGILVRDVSAYPGLAGCMRVSVGASPALRATRQALSEILPKTTTQEEKP
jgi:histidinol-phosphate aminotransferase